MFRSGFFHGRGSKLSHDASPFVPNSGQALSRGAGRIGSYAHSSQRQQQNALKKPANKRLVETAVSTQHATGTVVLERPELAQLMADDSGNGISSSRNSSHAVLVDLSPAATPRAAGTGPSNILAFSRCMSDSRALAERGQADRRCSLDDGRYARDAAGARRRSLNIEVAARDSPAVDVPVLREPATPGTEDAVARCTPELAVVIPAAELASAQLAAPTEEADVAAAVAPTVSAEEVAADEEQEEVAPAPGVITDAQWPQAAWDGSAEYSDASYYSQESYGMPAAGPLMLQPPPPPAYPQYVSVHPHIHGHFIHVAPMPFYPPHMVAFPQPFYAYPPMPAQQMGAMPMGWPFFNPYMPPPPMQMAQLPPPPPPPSLAPPPPPALQSQGSVASGSIQFGTFGDDVVDFLGDGVSQVGSSAAPEFSDLASVSAGSTATVARYPGRLHAATTAGRSRATTVAVSINSSVKDAAGAICKILDRRGSCLLVAIGRRAVAAGSISSRNSSSNGTAAERQQSPHDVSSVAAKTLAVGRFYVTSGHATARVHAATAVAAPAGTEEVVFTPFYRRTAATEAGSGSFGFLVHKLCAEAAAALPPRTNTHILKASANTDPNGLSNAIIRNILEQAHVAVQLAGNASTHVALAALVEARERLAHKFDVGIVTLGSFVTEDTQQALGRTSVFLRLDVVRCATRGSPLLPTDQEIVAQAKAEGLQLFEL